MTITFEPHRNTEFAKERLARTDNPRHRAILEQMIAHTGAEGAGDLDALMATVSPNAKYHTWIDFDEVGPNGYEGVRQFYIDLLATGAVLESIKDRLIVDDDYIVQEGPIRFIMNGTLARQHGWEVDDEEALYLSKSHTVVVWVFDEDALVVSEDGYGSKISIEKIDPADIGPDVQKLIDHAAKAAESVMALR